MSVENMLWVEKYRPTKIDDCIIPERLKSEFRAIVESGNLPNMSLVGAPGTGKTTVARALCEEMNYDYILINASEEGNIDTIRTLVRGFGSTVSLTSEMKCIILDEADYLNAKSSQPALRGVIEEFADNCRFILTANYGNRIIQPLYSRCPSVEFAFSKPERKEMILGFHKRLTDILTGEGVEHDPDQVFAMCVTHFPDFRKVINLLQRFSAGGKLNNSSGVGISDEAINVLCAYIADKEFGKMRKWVVENIDNDGEVLRRALYDRCSSMLVPDSIPELILLLNQYDYRESFVADREINTVAMLTEIMSAVTFK